LIAKDHKLARVFDGMVSPPSKFLLEFSETDISLDVAQLSPDDATASGSF